MYKVLNFAPTDFLRLCQERGILKKLGWGVFLLPSPLSLFSLSDFPLLITAVGCGVGVPTGCRSPHLPFLSLTPFPPLPPTRLSGALTLPGNMLPVKFVRDVTTLLHPQYCPGSFRKPLSSSGEIPACT